MSEVAQRPPDPWNEARIAAVDETGVRAMANLLELRGSGADQTTIRATYLDLLQIEPGERVLDVGCGSGVVTREVARRVGTGGSVVGVDPSATMLAVAQELAERDGVAAQIAFQVGDARALPVEDGSFDVVLAITALSHTTDGEEALPELLRALRPGGRIGIFDLDTPSWIITHPDRDLTRRVGLAGSMVATDGMLARRLPGLLEAAGVEDVQIRAYTPLERDPAGFNARLAERWAEAAAECGAISEEERQRWVDGLHAEQAANRFLSGLTHLFIWGRVPAAP